MQKNTQDIVQSSWVWISAARSPQGHAMKYTTAKKNNPNCKLHVKTHDGAIRKRQFKCCVVEDLWNFLFLMDNHADFVAAVLQQLHFTEHETLGADELLLWIQFILVFVETSESTAINASWFWWDGKGKRASLSFLHSDLLGDLQRTKYVAWQRKATCNLYKTSELFSAPVCVDLLRSWTVGFSWQDGSFPAELILQNGTEVQSPERTYFWVSLMFAVWFNWNEMR